MWANMPLALTLSFSSARARGCRLTASPDCAKHLSRPGSERRGASRLRVGLRPNVFRVGEQLKQLIWTRVFLREKKLGRLVGFEPTTSRTTIWRYYQLSYSRRVLLV